jgi:hypothetical protein
MSDFNEMPSDEEDFNEMPSDEEDFHTRNNEPYMGELCDVLGPNPKMKDLRKALAEHHEAERLKHENETSKLNFHCEWLFYHRNEALQHESMDDDGCTEVTLFVPACKVGPKCAWCAGLFETQWAMTDWKRKYMSIFRPEAHDHSKCHLISMRAQCVDRNSEIKSSQPESSDIKVSYEDACSLYPSSMVEAFKVLGDNTQPSARLGHKLVLNAQIYRDLRPRTL